MWVQRKTICFQKRIKFCQEVPLGKYDCLEVHVHQFYANRYENFRLFTHANVSNQQPIVTYCKHVVSKSAWQGRRRRHTNTSTGVPWLPEHRRTYRDLDIIVTSTVSPFTQLHFSLPIMYFLFLVQSVAIKSCGQRRQIIVLREPIPSRIGDHTCGHAPSWYRWTSALTKYEILYAIVSSSISLSSYVANIIDYSRTLERNANTVFSANSLLGRITF